MSEEHYNDTGKQQKTLRDEFAMAAMAGMVYDLNRHAEAPQSSIDEVAAHSYRVADAMMRQREMKA